MATTYTTRQGETVDLACHAHYGRTEKVTEIVLAANPGTAASVILPLGTRLVMPDYDTKAAATPLVSLWD
jgi:phage tail protein X